MQRPTTRWTHSFFWTCIFLTIYAEAYFLSIYLSLSLYIYIYIYVYTYTHTYIHIYIYTCIYIYIYIYICIYINTIVHTLCKGLPRGEPEGPGLRGEAAINYIMYCNSWARYILFYSILFYSILFYYISIYIYIYLHDLILYLCYAIRHILHWGSRSTSSTTCSTRPGWDPGGAGYAQSPY